MTHHDGVTIGSCAHCAGRASRTAGPSHVLDDKLLAEQPRHVLANDARSNISCPARSDRHDDRHRARRIGLGPSYMRHGWQRGSARCQMQKFRRGSFIVASPSREGPFDHLVGAAGYGVYVCAPPGRRTVKAEPLPGSLVTVTSPPIMRASLRVMARPRPVPPNRCAVVASACVNSSNSLACCSGRHPNASIGDRQLHQSCPLSSCAP